MTLFASLPLLIQTKVLSQWLHISGITKLDSAYTNYDSRGIVLHALEHNDFVITWLKIDGVNFESLKYVSLRGIKMKQLVLNRPNIAAQHSLAPYIDTSKVTSLIVLNCQLPVLSENVLSNLINACVSLKSLEVATVACFTDKVVTVINPAILEQLESFKLTSRRNKGLNVESLQYLSEHTKQLSQFSFDVEPVSKAVGRLVSVPVNRVVTIDHREEEVTHEDKIVHVDVPQSFPEKHMIQLVTSNPYLQEIMLNGVVVSFGLFDSIVDTCSELHAFELRQFCRLHNITHQTCANLVAKFGTTLHRLTVMGTPIGGSAAMAAAASGGSGLTPTVGCWITFQYSVQQVTNGIIDRTMHVSDLPCDIESDYHCGVGGNYTDCSRDIVYLVNAVPDLTSIVIHNLKTARYVCDILDTIRVRNPNLRELKLDACAHISVQDIRYLLNECHALTNIAFLSDVYSSDFLKAVFGPSERTSNDVMLKYPTSSVTLVTLNGNIRLRTDTVTYILQHNPQIEHMDLQSCKHVDVAVIRKSHRSVTFKSN